MTDRQTNSLAGGVIGPHPPLQYLLPHHRIHTRTIIFNLDLQCATDLLQLNGDLADGKLVGVIQQIAKKFEQVILLAAKGKFFVMLEGNVNSLVLVDLGHGGEDLLQHRQGIHATAAEQLASCHGPSQMVLDHVVHQRNLFIEPLSCLGAELLILHGGLDQGQARLQAMGQIIHGVLVAAGLFALIIQ